MSPSHLTRRPLPAVVFIGALTVVTALVWVRVLDRAEQAGGPSSSSCSTPPPAQPTVLPQPHAVSVLVLNSTNRDKLATETKKRLQVLGFKVTQATNDDATYGGHGVIAGVGEIRYGSAAFTSAALLHLYLDTARMVPNDSSSATVTLSLGAKFTHLHSKATVLAEVDKQGLTLTSTIPPAPPPPVPSC